MSENITPSHVANFFLKEARVEDLKISPMKLIKLTYIGYGWIKSILDEKLFEEGIRAWKHGPVIPSLYHEFKIFRDKPINTFSMQLDDQKFKEGTNPEIGGDKKDILFVLKYVWDVYKGFTAWSLSEMTHSEGTPWHQTYKEVSPYSVIDPDIIKSHFDAKIDEYLKGSKVT